MKMKHVPEDDSSSGDSNSDEDETDENIQQVNKDLGKDNSF